MNIVLLSQKLVRTVFDKCWDSDDINVFGSQAR